MSSNMLPYAGFQNPYMGSSNDLYTQMMMQAYLNQAQKASGDSANKAVSFSGESEAQARVQAETRAQNRDLYGADDGKIGFKNALKNIGKGCVNLVKNMFCKDGKFSLKRTLKTVVITAASIALCVACPPAAPVLIAVGATAGALQLGKGVVNACSAKTDAAKAQAFQDIGGGALTVGLAVAGSKGALKASGKAPNFSGNPFKSTVQCFKITKDYGKSALAGIKKGGALRQKATYAKAWESAKTNLRDFYSDASTLNRVKSKPDKKFTHYEKKLNEQLEQITADLESGKISKEVANTRFERLLKLEEQLSKRYNNQKTVAQAENIIKNRAEIDQKQDMIKGLFDKVSKRTKIAEIQKDALEQIYATRKPETLDAIIAQAKTKLSKQSMKILNEACEIKRQAFTIRDAVAPKDMLGFWKTKYLDSAKNPILYTVPAFASNSTPSTRAVEVPPPATTQEDVQAPSNNSSAATNPFAAGSSDLSAQYLALYKMALAQSGYC